MARSYAWLATGGGAWSLASNWDDLTDGIDPSLTVPGAQDTVSLAGPAGSAIGTVTGPGMAALAAFSGNLALSGRFGFGDVTLGSGGAGGLLAIGPASSVQAGTATVASGSLLASGDGASLAVAGTLTLGAGQSGFGAASAALEATGGGVVAVASLVLDASSASVFVDAASVLDVGGTGHSAAGALTVESGAVLSGFGNADAYGTVVNGGTILASGGELMLGAVSGTGSLAIAAGAILELNGRTGAGQSLFFEGNNGTLALSAEIDAPGGAIRGFGIGDAIDELGSPISVAAYVQTGNNTGVLSLLYGNQIADTFTLLGNYAGDAFLVSGDGAGGSLITVAPDGSSGGGLSSGTSTPDAYQWLAGGSGAWDVRANWTDVTTGASPANVAAGSHDLVSIAAPSASFIVIAGPGDAASLGVTGDLALAGTFAVGSLALGVASGGTQTLGTLDLLPGSTLSAASATVADGALSAIGSATSFSVSGTLVLGGGPPGVGLPTATLSAVAGARVQLDGLVMGGGAGAALLTDPTGSIEIGTAGGAAAGAVTVDAGATLSGNGAVDPFGRVMDNGTIAAAGGTLALGSVSGSGVLSIGAGAGLLLEAATATAIDFSGANATLLLADELVAPSGVISGFAAGDTIDVQNDPLSGYSFAAGSGSGPGTLSLYYDGTVVARMLLAGDYSGDKFVLTPDGGYGTDIAVAQNEGGGGGGQGNTDLLSWTSPVSGDWNRAANWTDVTTGAPATVPPGTQNAVLITGPSSGFQVVGGPAVCASLSFLGDTAIQRSFTTGTLTVGSAGTAGQLAVIAGAVLASGQAALLNGGVTLDGRGSAWSNSGTLVLGGGAPGQGQASTLISVTGSASLQTGGLMLGGGLGDAIETDGTGWVEIGSAGGAAAGAITVDPGVSVAGNGSLNIGGAVIDQGTITAEGGTLALGNVSGTGGLAIASEAVLALDGSTLVPIGFAGSGATLLIEGLAAPLGVISGFAPGDEIVTGNALVSGVSYAPGNGAVGTLTLQYAGAPALTLLLAGGYAGETFSVLPDGNGSAVVVTSANGGASGGTATPDDYAWTGADNNGQWNDAGNWADQSAGESPAAVAPGLNDLCTVQGAASGYLTLTGPADAASLDLLGGVSLSGSYALGALAVAGTLALGPSGLVNAASAAVAGSVLDEGGALAVSGTLALGAGAVLEAAMGGRIVAGALQLGGATVATDGSGGIEVGGDGDAMAGAVVVDAGAQLFGAGALDLAGQVVDAGSIVASGGTLALGAVSGGGTLVVGVGATLALEAGAAGVVIDFAGPGTLTIAAGIAPTAAIADFSSGDMIVLPLSGVTSTGYVQTGPGIGVLTLYAGDQAVEALTLEGVGAGQSFFATSEAGSTALTTEPGASGSGGGMQQGDGSGSGGSESPMQFLEGLPMYQQFWLGQAIGVGSPGGVLEPYVYTSPDGSSWGPFQPGYANIGIAMDPAAGQSVYLPMGYVALLAEGNAPINLVDGRYGHAVLVGNGGVDDIVDANAVGDTLVGGTGPGDEFWTDTDSTIVGNGNDTIVTAQGNDSIITSAEHSLVLIGTGYDTVNSNGTDTIVSEPGLAHTSTVWAGGNDQVWGPNEGMLDFNGFSLNGSSGVDTVVGGAGSLRFTGGAASGSVLWAENAQLAQYFGGAGSAIVVGGSGNLDVYGGSGAVTVFGGTGYAYIQGAPGPSTYVVGDGRSVVLAASGNQVWLVGAANNTLVASGGNVLFAGFNSFGNNSYWAGSGPTTVYGGHGSDTLMAGAGTSTMVGGSGHDQFGFIAGSPHGAEVISNFVVGQDVIGLYGYAGGVAAVLASEKVSGGNTYLTLQDGTEVTVLHVSGLGASSFVV